MAQKEISRINTDSAQEIARINTENAQKVERIKAEGQRDLEREKFNREWRRERVRPLLDKLEALRVRNLGAIAAVSSYDTGMAERTIDQIERDVTATELDLRSICVPELQSLLEALIHADAQWPSAYRQWINTDLDYRVRLVDSDWKHLLDEAEKARLELVNEIDAYIYLEQTSGN